MAGIYIHIPFCATRCIYCDFFTQTNTSNKAEYVSAVCKEIALRKEYLEGEPIKTIYFGGGTPSLLSAKEFELIFEAIHSNHAIANNAEITLEANPDDLTPSYLQMLRSFPFNRLSMGIQSFDDEELKFLNRRHTANEAIEAVRNSQKSGFDNISIDLMYGLPNQSLELWTQNIDKALQLGIQHISAYHLIYEEGTKLFKLLNKGKVKEADEELSLEMFSTLINKLKEGGFEQYEISNFAKDGLISKHNSSYWLGTKYIGIGTAAHSFDGKNRSWNISSIPQYIEGVGNNSPKQELEILSFNERYNDFILTGMRTVWGVNLMELEKRFDQKMLDYCLANVQKHIESRFVIKEDNILKLSHKGIFISDSIMSDLMYVDNSANENL